MHKLEIIDLHANIDEKEILKGVNLTANSKEVHAIMGPNGSGKSTLAYTLLGHPKYTVTKGDIRVDGESILELSTDERAKKGLFLGFQYPVEVSGVGYTNFLRNAYTTLSKAYGDNMEVFLTVREFHDYVKKNLDIVGFDPSFLTRYLNEGFSGGEKKRSEVLQMLVLKPRFVILDEPDSGLDIDAVKSVANAINHLIENTDASIIVITHYARILRYLNKLDYVHVMAKGKIAKSGGRELAEMLEEKGYSWLEE
ncbi:MAG: ABC transporter ATP-binding protein [Candidatus Nitrosocaldaceae archaeon]|nr:MAG: ABC transporter ATP-binding protein [Candidatus Nitrosocaldaceae archaeon]